MNDERRDIPIAACRFRADVCEFEAADDRGSPVRITARSGQPIEHWWWGRIVHDLAGMHLHKPRLPLDYCHRDGEVIGYLDQFTTASNQLVATGRLVPFGDQDRASEVQHKANAGVPYEASINFGGDGIRLEELKEGKSAVVNGFNFAGPGIIVREWPLRGVAVCPYGADMRTESTFDRGEKIAVTVFKQEEKKIMADDATPADVIDVDVIDVAADVAAAEAGVGLLDLKQLVADALTASRAEAKRFIDAFGPYAGVWFAEGLTFDQCRDKQLAQLQADKATLEARLAAVHRGEAEPVNFQAGPEETPGGKARQQHADNFGEGLAALIAYNAAILAQYQRN